MGLSLKIAVFAQKSQIFTSFITTLTTYERIARPLRYQQIAIAKDLNCAIILRFPYPRWGKP